MRARQHYRRARHQAIVALVVITVLAAAAVWSGGWGIDAHSAGVLPWLAFLLPLAVIAVGGALLARYRARSPHTGWDVHAHGGFVAPAALTGVWAAAILVALVGAILSGNLASRHTDAFAGQLHTVAMIVVAICLAAAGALTWQALSDHGGLVLTARGVRVPRPFGAAFVPWDALALPDPGGDHLHGAAPFTIGVNRPDPLDGGPDDEGGPDRFVIDGRDFHINPELIARALREYVTHPARRAAIGTPAECARLNAPLDPGTPSADPVK